MEAPAGATNLLKLETSGADLSKPLPLGYANEFTVVFSDVHNSESGRSIESKEINAGPFKWYTQLSLEISSLPMLSLSPTYAFPCSESF